MHRSYWHDTAAVPEFEKLQRNVHVDVVVIGGGMTGISAAYFLKRLGRKVALLERNRVIGADSGQTTAHLTCETDVNLNELAQTFGEDHAKAAWDAGQFAIHLIEENVRRHKIDCDFKRVPGYLTGSLKSTRRGEENRSEIMEDTRLAATAGFDALFMEKVPLFDRIGMRLGNQAKFNPVRYLSGLAATIPGGGSHIFEHCEVTAVADSPTTVMANGHTITCDYVVVATHVGLMGNSTLIGTLPLQMKIAPYSTYVIGATLPRGVGGGSPPEALWWDMSDPYFYLRIDSHPSGDYAIFGGADHKTGQVGDTDVRYLHLEETLREFLPEARVDHRWTGQVVESNDGLPFIGEVRPGRFVATGFAGQGMTFGTLSGQMACDAILSVPNPWKELFDPNRVKLRGGLWDYVKENIDYPWYMIRDRLRQSEGDRVESVKPDEGKILLVNGERLAVHRDAGGRLTVLSATCTHMGCIVHWNSAEATWDCPCHGSRFKCTGEVLAGPAVKALEQRTGQPVQE